MMESKSSSKHSWPRIFVLFMAFIFVPQTRAQFVMSIVFDNAEAEAVLGAVRVPFMDGAIFRVESYFAQLLESSNANFVVSLRWQPPDSPLASADASGPPRAYSWNSVKDALIRVAEAGNEPFVEIIVYKTLPPESIPFVWAPSDSTSAPRLAQTGVLTYPQAQQLGLNPLPPGPEEVRIRFRPPITGTLQWQFHPGGAVPGAFLFDQVLLHEVLHLLGYISAAEGGVVPGGLYVLDTLRFADSNFPLTSGTFGTSVRELRPTTEASIAVSVIASLTEGAFPMSRGSRPSGDGFQSSHFRSFTRLNPQDPVGVMDPGVSRFNNAQRVGELLRPDVQVLDALGWVLDGPGAKLKLPGPLRRPEQQTPTNGAILRDARPVFTWTDTTTNSDTWGINVFRENPNTTPDVVPFRFAYELTNFSYQLPLGEELSPGLYYWEAIGFPNQVQTYASGYRAFTIACPSDFNLDGIVDFFDYLDYIDAFSSTDPSADFNRDGSVDFFDYLDFIEAYSSGC